jgi:hypothetical protein
MLSAHPQILSTRKINVQRQHKINEIYPAAKVPRFAKLRNHHLWGFCTGVVQRLKTLPSQQARRKGSKSGRNAKYHVFGIFFAF